MSETKNLSVKLYLDGIEVPVNSVNVTHSMQEGSTAQIAVPAHSSLQDIKSRTMAHLFYATNDVDSLEDMHEEYKLLFEGEVTGTGFKNTKNNRTVTLQAEGLSSYLRTASVMQAGYHQSYNLESMKVSRFLEADDSDVIKPNNEDILTSLRDRWTQIITESESITDAIRTILADLTRYDPFLKSATKRLLLVERVREISEEIDLDINEILSEDVLSKIIMQRVGQTRGEFPILNLLQVILSTFNYTVKFDASIMRSFMMSPHLNFASPPRCNVITPDMFNNISFNHNFLQENTRSVVYRQSMKGATDLAMWPNKLNKAIDHMLSSDSDPSESKILNEEKIKGVIPSVSDYSSQLISGLETNRNDDVKNHFRELALREFLINERNSGKCRVSGRFNPEAICGFTGFVVDPTFDVIYGNFSSVTHQIDAQQGSASTSYTIDLPQRLINNPRKLKQPRLSPFYRNVIGENTPNEPDKTDNVSEIYSKLINGDFESVAERKSVSTIDLDKPTDYFKNFQNPDIYKSNHVRSRAVIAMGQVVRDEEPITTDKYKERAHPNINHVFGKFYGAENINESDGLDKKDIWDLTLADSDSTVVDFEDDDLAEMVESRRKPIATYRKALTNNTGTVQYSKNYDELFDFEDE